MDTSERDPRVHLERDPQTHVARVTIDNPERRNAYDPAMRRAMGAYLEELATDDDIKVVILRGANGVFSTGADMKNSYSWYGADGEKRRPEPTPASRRRPGELRLLPRLPDVPEGHRSPRSRPTRSAARSSWR